MARPLLVGKNNKKEKEIEKASRTVIKRARGWMALFEAAANRNARTIRYVYYAVLVLVWYVLAGFVSGPDWD